MAKIKFVFLALGILSFSFSSASNFDKEKKRLGERMKWFDGVEHCGDFGTSTGMTFSSAEGNYRQSSKVLKHRTEKKKPDLKFPQRDCFQLPKGFEAHLIETNECYAKIAIVPSKLPRKKAQYLLSDIHRFPSSRISERLHKKYFDEKKIPFKKNISKWKELIGLRAQLRDIDVDEADERDGKKKYKGIYSALLKDTMFDLRLKKSELEVIEYGYVGCP